MEGLETQYYTPPYRPYSRSKTTYSGMNDWAKQVSGSRPSHIPVTQTDANWRELQPVASVPAYAPRQEDARTDEYYKRYARLSQNIAYRFPDPGPPRERQGRIGGNWRHIKEVLGHGGSRVIFVDGLVRLYDGDINNSAAQARAFRSQLSTPVYAANRHDVPSYAQLSAREFEKSRYRPYMTGTETMQGMCPPTPSAYPPAPPSVSSGRYKGFYSAR